jgi:hypothetical protein
VAASCWRSAIEWALKGSDPVTDQLPVDGSKSSAELNTLAASAADAYPPTTNTLPDARVTAAWPPLRAIDIGPVVDQLPVTGSYLSTEDNGLLNLS